MYDWFVACNTCQRITPSIMFNGNSSPNTTHDVVTDRVTNRTRFLFFCKDCRGHLPVQRFNEPNGILNFVCVHCSAYYNCSGSYTVDGHKMLITSKHNFIDCPRCSKTSLVPLPFVYYHKGVCLHCDTKVPNFNEQNDLCPSCETHNVVSVLTFNILYLIHSYYN